MREHARTPLELLTAVDLAARLGIAVSTLRARRDLPRPLRIAGRHLFLLSEVEQVLPRRRYSDVVTAPELAALLHVTRSKLYTLIEAGIVPPARRIGKRAVWSRQNVEQHLRALPRI